MTPIMTNTIAAGSIWVKDATHLPASLLLESEPHSNGWVAVRDDRLTFEKALREAGWTFFFMAGEIGATVFGFDRQKALGAALKRLTAIVTLQHCNSIEITRVSGRSFLGIPYLKVSAHPRHVQRGVLFSPDGAGSEPAPFPATAQSKWRVTVS